MSSCRISQEDSLKREIQRLQLKLKEKLQDHGLKLKEPLQESNRGDAEIIQKSSLKALQKASHEELHKEPREASHEASKLNLQTTYLDSKLSQTSLTLRESSGSPGEQAGDNVRIDSRLHIINVDSNEESSISRFWSIEPGSRQGIRIRLFRNGDRFFRGMEYAICHTKCKTLSYLLDQLNMTSVQDAILMPYGVRRLFNLQGLKIKDILDLKDGGIYVVSSANRFIKMDYLRLQTMLDAKKIPNKPLMSENSHLDGKRLKAIEEITSEERLASVERRSVVDKARKIVMIYVVRNDVVRPRKVLKWLFGPKSAATFERAMSTLSEKLALSSGLLKNLHASDGTEIKSLEDLYSKSNQVFFGFGQETVRRSDFNLEKEEIKMITELTKRAGSYHNDKVLIIPFVQNDPDKPVLLEHYRLNDATLCTNENKVSLKMCKDLKNNHNYLVKIFDMRKLTKPQQLKVRREMKIMRMLKHANLIYADIITFDDNFSCLYIKKFPKCSLAEILLNDNHYHCERFVSDVVMQLSRGLEHLGSYQVVNRNVTLESIVADITFSGIVQFKLCDFGMARKSKSLNQKLHVICGNPSYIAPEVLVGEGYDTRVDTWSLGVLMYILLTGQPPFQGEDLNDCNGIFTKITEGHFDVDVDPIWDMLSGEVRSLMILMLCSDPNQRISPQKIQTHVWTNQSSIYAPEKDLRPAMKQKLHKHIMQQEMMSVECLEVLCLSSLNKEPYYFVNSSDEIGEEDGRNGSGMGVGEMGVGEGEVGERKVGEGRLVSARVE